jgi:hypothetical protein
VYPIGLPQKVALELRQAVWCELAGVVAGGTLRLRLCLCALGPSSSGMNIEHSCVSALVMCSGC